MRFVLFTAANLRSSLYSRAGYARFLSIIRVFFKNFITPLLSLFCISLSFLRTLLFFLLFLDLRFAH